MQQVLLLLAFLVDQEAAEVVYLVAFHNREALVILHQLLHHKVVLVEVLTEAVHFTVLAAVVVRLLLVPMDHLLMVEMVVTEQLHRSQEVQ